MAARDDMAVVRVGKATYKVRRKDLDAYLKAHPGAEVVGGYQTKQETKPAAKKSAPKKTDGKE